MQEPTRVAVEAEREAAIVEPPPSGSGQSGPTAEPKRQKPKSREHPLVFMLGLAVAILIGVLGRDDIPVLDRLEATADDYRVALFSPTVPVHPKIAVIAITEAELAKMKRRQPLDRDYLARLLATLKEAKPAAIGLDILFDHPTEPAEDEHLRHQLADMDMPVLLANGSAKFDPDEMLTVDQSAFLTSFLRSANNPLVQPALVHLPVDLDNVVRRTPVPTGIASTGDSAPSLSAGLVVAAGWQGTAPEGRIVYYGYQGHVIDRLLTLPGNLVDPDSQGWQSLRKLIEGRIVLIGSNYADTDQHDTPFSVSTQKSMSGVFIQASLVAQMIDGDRIRLPGLIELSLIAVTVVGIGFYTGLRCSRNWVTLSIIFGVVLLIWGFGTAAYLFPTDGGHQRALYPVFSPSIAAIAATTLGYALTRQQFQAQRNFVRGALAKYVSASVAKQLIDDPSLLQVGGDRRIITVIFTDIEGFTTLSESLEPQDLANILNAYLRGMTRIVYEFDGTLDKYIGDAVVALWGAPVPTLDHAARALDCVVAMSKFATAFAEEQRSAGISFGRTRIGVQTGPAIVGNFGGDERLQYTAIGDTINFASRLEGANKYLGTRILVGQTAVNASGRRDCRPVADLVVKGKEEAVSVFEPVPEWQPIRLAQYREAYRLMANDDPGALAAFERLADEHDPVILLHINRLSTGQHGTRIVLDDK